MVQRTRLSTLVEGLAERSSRWLFNPWRRTSLVIIALLLGNFFAIAVSSVAGQTADLDIVMALFFLGGVEGASWLVYRRTPASDQPRGLPVEMLNAFKLGVTYGLFLEAFKLAS